MSKLIKIESLAGELPLEIIRAESGRLSIGREPENYIVVDSDSISRRHGCLIEANGNWVFHDFGSTNGSWLNGVKIDPGRLRIIRHKDVLQLADFPLRISEVSHDETILPELASVLVFYNGRFESEFPLPLGSQFSIDGPNADFLLSEKARSAAVLEIRAGDTALELQAGASFGGGEGGLSVVLNGMAAAGVSVLSDKDEVVVGPYTLLVNAACFALRPGASMFRPGAGHSPQVTREIHAYERPNLPAHLRPKRTNEWESEAARRKSLKGKSFVFGSSTKHEDVTATVDLRHGTRRTAGFDMSSAQRFSAAIAQRQAEGDNSLSEALLIAFGVIIFMLILALLAYLFLLI